MEFLTYVAVYFIIWWTCLFVTLPFGVRGQHEDGVVTDGTDPGAPVKAFNRRKMLATTIISFFVLLLVLWAMSGEWVRTYWS